MSKPTTRWARAIVIGGLSIVAGVVGPGGGPALAGPAAPDLPVTAEVCKSDTGPNLPSCGPDLRVTGGTAVVARRTSTCTGNATHFPCLPDPVIVFCIMATGEKEWCEFNYG